MYKNLWVPTFIISKTNIFIDLIYVAQTISGTFIAIATHTRTSTHAHMRTHTEGRITGYLLLSDMETITPWWRFAPLC